MTFHKLLHNLTLLTTFTVLNTLKIPPITKYCEFDDQNTPCLYKCTLAKRCKQLHVPFEPLTTEEREYVLRRHNELRDEVASGAHTNTFLPKAANMQVMSYDLECEFLAACYIHQCIWDHDKVRITFDDMILGQNLFTSMSSKPKKADTIMMEKAVQGWFTENRFMTQAYSDVFFKEGYKNIDLPEGQMLGHMTQMLWANTKFVGCAKLSSRREEPSYTLDFYCDYRPTGNVRTRNVYEVGEPRSKCSGSHTQIYLHLCGTIRSFEDDKYIPPMPELIGYHPHMRKSRESGAVGLSVLKEKNKLVTAMMIMLIILGY